MCVLYVQCDWWGVGLFICLVWSWLCVTGPRREYALCDLPDKSHPSAVCICQGPGSSAYRCTHPFPSIIVTLFCFLIPLWCLLCSVQMMCLILIRWQADNHGSVHWSVEKARHVFVMSKIQHCTHAWKDMNKCKPSPSGIMGVHMQKHTQILVFRGPPSDYSL